MPNYRALKISREENKFGCTLIAELRCRVTRALPQIVLNTSKKPLLNSSHKMKHAKFSYPKKSRNPQKFQKLRLSP